MQINKLLLKLARIYTSATFELIIVAVNTG